VEEMILGQAKYILTLLLPIFGWIAAILFRARHRPNAELYKDLLDIYVHMKSTINVENVVASTKLAEAFDLPKIEGRAGGRRA